MSKRVLIQAGRMRIAMAGYDADTADAMHLLFDSNGSPYNAAYITGRLLAGAFSESSASVPNGGTRITRTASVWFGKTFATAPRLFWGALDPNNGGLYTPNLNLNSITQGSTSGSITGAALTATRTVYNDHADFVVDYLHYGSDELNRYVDIPYVFFLN